MKRNMRINDREWSKHMWERIKAMIAGEGYISAETDPTVPAWAKQPNKPSYTASEVGALPNTTTIPTKTSDLTNDSGFITASFLQYTEVTGTTDPTTGALNLGLAGTGYQVLCVYAVNRTAVAVPYYGTVTGYWWANMHTDQGRLLTEEQITARVIYIQHPQAQTGVTS